MSMVPHKKLIPVVEGKTAQRMLEVTRLGVGPLRTDAGNFWQFYFQVSDQWCEYAAIVKAQLDDSLMPVFRDSEDLLLRIDSGCQTGQVFGDRTCECREQLTNAMETIARKGEGIVVWVPQQDGRGMGLGFKLATLFLQKELAFHTVRAAKSLSGACPIDRRSYTGVISILKFLGCTKDFRFRLLTNNPAKLRSFSQNGFRFRVAPLAVAPTPLTRCHLAAKKRYLGHSDLLI
jgi:GTP cyclohydrolase II